MFKLFRKYGIFLFVPGIVLGYSILLKLAAGPYWLATNFDPAYQYLVNGMRLVKGMVPNHTDHPGTPLQMLCATVCWLFNIGRSVTDTATHVFISPEFYLHAIFVVLSLFSFITSVGLAVYVFQKTKDGLAAVLTQLPALSFLVLKSWETSEPILPVTANVFPETMLIGIVNLFNFCFLKRYFSGTSKRGYSSTILWGFVCGLGVAVKITFIPLLAIPLIILSWKNRFLFIAVFIASFVVWTVPILSVYPVLWEWIVRILTHTGNLGYGDSGIIEKHQYFSSWINIIDGQKVYAGLLLAVLILCFWKLARKKWQWDTTCLLAAMLGVFFQFAIVAKNPGTHYLLPGLGLFSALLVLLYLQGPFHHKWGHRIVLTFVLVFIFVGTWQANEYRLRLAALTQDILTFHEHVHAKYKGFNFVGFYRSSGQETALSFGDQYSGSWEELFKLYPDSYIFHRWNIRMRNFKGRVISNDVLARYPGVLLEGDGDYDFSPTPYTVRLLEKGRLESVFLLTNSTEKQSIMLHLAAQYFSHSGDYLKALQFESQAKVLHYPTP